MSNFLGIDENGYGPVMGPLIVTGICANKDIKKDWTIEIRDSKRLFLRDAQSYRKIEEISLAQFFLLFGRFPESPKEFIEKLSFGECPNKFKNICIENIPHVFSWAPKSDVTGYIDFFDGFLKKNSIKINGIKSAILCPFEFNILCDGGIKKDLIDFLQFEKIIKHFSDKDPEISISAGKIGGRNKYLEFVSGTFPSLENKAIRENPEESSYVFRNKNKNINISFLKDIEKKSFLACLSGIIGKYIRELIMTGINISLGNKEFVSGYREKKTKEFLKRFFARQNYKDININCIIRKK
ncbi:MAG: hypothetical protein M1501_01480 [Candidatus Omnitrophica bacterium]|nr:hypothetical protein [Candidatus Omnitrophota bacterium]